MDKLSDAGQRNLWAEWVAAQWPGCEPHLCLAVQRVIDEFGVVAQLLEACDGTQHPCGLTARQQSPGGIAQQKVLIQRLLQGSKPAAHHLHDLQGAQSTGKGGGGMHPQRLSGFLSQ